MARRDTTALIKRLKKRINMVKRKVPLAKLPEVLDTVDVLDIEGELELEAEDMHSD